MVIDANMLLVPDIRQSSRLILKALEAGVEDLAGREIGSFLEDAFTEMIPLRSLAKLEATTPSLPQELRQADREQLDRAVLRLIGVPNAEIPPLLQRIYRETTLIYRRGRVLDIRTAANKRSAKKGNSATPHEIAESIMESLPSGLLQLYPADFLLDSEATDHYSLPEGHASLVEDMFHHPRLKFKGDDIEFRHRPQVELALALHESGLSGPLTLPVDPDRCLEIDGRWRTYREGLTGRFQEEVAQRTPDEEKAGAALKLLLRWSTGK
jgi:hypothetical protein